MQPLYLYSIGLLASLVLGVFLAFFLNRGLSSLLSLIFPQDIIKKFWLRLINVIILLAAVSGALANTYPTEAGGDRLILIFSFMDQLEGMGIRLLVSSLVLASVLLIVFGFTSKKKP